MNVLFSSPEEVVHGARYCISDGASSLMLPMATLMFGTAVR